MGPQPIGLIGLGRAGLIGLYLIWLSYHMPWIQLDHPIFIGPFNPTYQAVTGL